MPQSTLQVVGMKLSCCALDIGFNLCTLPAIEMSTRRFELHLDLLPITVRAMTFMAMQVAGRWGCRENMLCLRPEQLTTFQGASTAHGWLVDRGYLSRQKNIWTKSAMLLNEKPYAASRLVDDRVVH